MRLQCFPRSPGREKHQKAPKTPKFKSRNLATGLQISGQNGLTSNQKKKKKNMNTTHFLACSIASKK